LSQAEFRNLKPVMSKVAAYLFIAYGFYKVVLNCFTFPAGGELDKAMLFQIALGFGYVMCGLYLLIEKAKFEVMAAIFFIAFILEISQIGVY